MKLSLNKLGHEVQIINVPDPNQIIRMLNEFRPDFVHINYDDWVPLYEYIQYPCACTTHFAYIERPEMMGGYKQRVFDHFGESNLMCLVSLMVSMMCITLLQIFLEISCISILME